MFKFLQNQLESFLVKSRIGEVKVEEVVAKENQLSGQRFSSRKGYLKGVFFFNKETQESFVFSLHDREYYYTYQEYGIWQGLGVEFQPIVDDTLTIEVKDKKVKGWATSVFVRNLPTEQLFELPSPEQLRSIPLSNFTCPCPLCVIEYLEKHRAT
jgi:hypothetical protein